MKKFFFVGFAFFVFFTVFNSMAMQTHVADSWVMGCNNHGQCTAIGYYEQGEEDSALTGSFTHDAAWYVMVKWHRANAEQMTLQLDMLNRHPVDGEVTLLDGLGEKKYTHELKISQDGGGEEYYFFNIEKADFLTASKLTLSYQFRREQNDEIISHKESLDLREVNAFLQEILVNQFEETKPKPVMAFPCSSKRSIEAPLLKIWQDKYGETENDSCYHAEPPSAAANYIIDIINFGSLVILCNDRGYNGSATLWWRQGEGLTPIKFSSQSSQLLQNNDMIYENLIVGFYPDEDDQHLFRATFKGRGLADCGGQYQFVFNGQEFKIIGYAEMPKCANIHHWISLYDQPINRQ